MGYALFIALAFVFLGIDWFVGRKHPQTRGEHHLTT